MKKNRGKKGGFQISDFKFHVKTKKTAGNYAVESGIWNLKSKKTILFPEYFPFIAGGQVVLLNIIRHLKKKYNIRVILFNGGKIEQELAGMGISCDRMQAPKNARLRYWWKSIPLYFKLREYMRKNKVDLVYTGGYFTAKLAGPAAKAEAVPVIWHKHQIITDEKNAYLSRQIKKYSEYAGEIICVSEASKRSVERLGVDPKKISVVHNGMNIPERDKSRGAIIRKKHSLGKSFVAGTVGYFRKNKGIDILIKAAAIVREKEPAVKFMIVGVAEPGSEAYEKELRGMAEPLKDTVIFTGKQEQFKYLPAFDIFVLPSYDEPFALSVLEALAAGIPVIAFKSGGTPEIVKDRYNGFLVDDIDAARLAEKILLAYKNREKLKSMGENAEKTVKMKFRLKQQMEKIEKIIESVIDAAEKAG
jgi:glycosyltransferase involved in cell wall biosynthesis